MQNILLVILSIVAASFFLIGRWYIRRRTDFNKNKTGVTGEEKISVQEALIDIPNLDIIEEDNKKAETPVNLRRDYEDDEIEVFHKAKGEMEPLWHPARLLRTFSNKSAEVDTGRGPMRKKRKNIRPVTAA